MSGNVWEWMHDWRGGYPEETVTDPPGPSSGSCRVFRGGSWDNIAENCRSASRAIQRPAYRGDYLGFRLLRTAP